MTFFTADEQRLAQRFLDDGYVIEPSEDRAALDRIRAFVAATTAQFCGDSPPSDLAAYLEGVGANLEPSRLNALRLHVIDALANQEWFRAAYYSCGRSLLERLVGNELAMQRSLGLSVQVSRDESSVLPLHSDAWSEDSPFEVVLWIPLVDCRRTMSMFVLPFEADARWRDRMHEFSGGSVDAFTDVVADDLRYLDIAYGDVLLFTHTLMHGNRINQEPQTRWSINIRFKALFTPYADKQLGDFFDPITIRAATRVGMEYRLPTGFER